MLRKCLKKSAAAWTSKDRILQEERTKGSAEVIEFSYVFPLVLVTLAALWYLLLFLFFHVYAFHATEAAVEGALREVGGNRVYWQLSTHSLEPETEQRLSEELASKLQRMQILPGLHFATSFSENSTGSKVTATASCTFRGKPLFRVRSERGLRKPTEFAENVDLAEDLAAETGLTDFLKDRFGAYVDAAKRYGGKHHG